MSSKSQWFAVHTKVHSEPRAEFQLNRQGFQTFMPKHQKTIRHARKLRTVMTPLFPRYLFVSLDLGRDQWRSVNGTFGVSNLVMQGERPAALSDELVETFKSATDESGFVRFETTLKVGDSVRLTSGPFCDQIGELLSMDDAGRVKILLELLGGHIPVWSTAQSLAPAA